MQAVSALPVPSTSATRINMLSAMTLHTAISLLLLLVPKGSASTSDWKSTKRFVQRLTTCSGSCLGIRQKAAYHTHPRGRLWLGRRWLFGLQVKWDGHDGGFHMFSF